MRRMRSKCCIDECVRKVLERTGARAFRHGAAAARVRVSSPVRAPLLASRLKRKAKPLSDGDLVAVLEMRALEKERGEAEMAAASAAACIGAPAPKTPPS